MRFQQHRRTSAIYKVSKLWIRPDVDRRAVAKGVMKPHNARKRCLDRGRSEVSAQMAIESRLEQ